MIGEIIFGVSFWAILPAYACVLNHEIVIGVLWACVVGPVVAFALWSDRVRLKPRRGGNSR